MNFAMNPHAYWLAAPLLALLIFTPLAHTNSSGVAKVRAAAVAGSFYPSDAKELSAMIDGLMAQVAEPSITDPIIAAVAPHAGYPYSGASSLLRRRIMWPSITPPFMRAMHTQPRWEWCR